MIDLEEPNNIFALFPYLFLINKCKDFKMCFPIWQSPLTSFISNTSLHILYQSRSSIFPLFKKSTRSDVEQMHWPKKWQSRDCCLVFFVRIFVYNSWQITRPGTNKKRGKKRQVIFSISFLHSALLLLLLLLEFIENDILVSVSYRGRSRTTRVRPPAREFIEEREKWTEWKIFSTINTDRGDKSKNE